jgi:hypothetical protein
MKNFLQNNDFINYLQINAGYGIVGNAQMGNFLHLSTVGNSVDGGYHRYGTYPAVVPAQMGNSVLGPEKSAQLRCRY